MKIDHIALLVDNPADAAKWYCENFQADLIYSDETWAVVEFENIKLAFVVKHQHPAHFAFRTTHFNKSDTVKTHRDGTASVYKRDPWGNIYELIKYPDKLN